MKQCAKCLKWKDLTDFHNDTRRKDGRYPNCKTCHYAYARHRYMNQPGVREAQQERYRERFATEPGFAAKTQARSRKFYASISGRARTLYAGGLRRDPHATLTLKHVQSGIERGHCAVTGIAFDLSDNHQQITGRAKNPYAPSLDRINPRLGYTDDNTRIVIWQYNLMKGELSDSELLYICRILAGVLS